MVRSLNGNGGRASSGSSSNPNDLKTIEGLRALVEQQEQTPKKSLKERTFNALRTVGGIVNLPVSTISGMLSSIGDKDINILQGAAQGFRERETRGFSTNIREMLGIDYDEQSRGGKIAVGTVGFAADVLFDPITYLSFGMSSGLKLGSKTLTKAGTKTFQKAGRELTEEFIQKELIRKSMTAQARRAADRKVSTITKDLFEQAVGKKGLTEARAANFIKKGFSEGTIAEIRSLGPTLIDKGGVKFAGKTLFTSKELMNTQLGQAARRVGEAAASTKAGTAVTEIASVLKKTLGQTFVADFGKDPKLVKLMANATREQRQAFTGLIDTNRKLFGGLNDDEMNFFFNVVFDKKKQVVKRADELERIAIEEFNKKFPKDTLLKSKEGALGRLANIEQVGLKQTDRLTNAISKLGKDIGDTEVENLENFAKSMKDVLNMIRKKPTKKVVGDVKFGEDELEEALDFVLGGKKRDLEATITDITQKIGELDGLAKVGAKATVKASQTTGLDSLEKIALLRREILEVQNGIADRNGLLNRVVDSRQTAKAELRKQKLGLEDFDGNEKLLKISDQLFEGENSVVERLRKAAGIAEVDSIKFYIKSLFEDKRTLRNFGKGNVLSSPNTDFKKKFSGVEEGLVRNPFKALTTGQVDVATARIKDRAFKGAIKALRGSKVEKEGLVKVTRKQMNGEKIEAWFPKEIADELNQFLTPQLKGLDALAKATGFDWATGLFKSYVTSMFPGFHMRNITSNQFQNMLKVGVDVLNVPMQKAALDITRGKNLYKVLKLKTGGEITYGQVRKQIEKNSDIFSQTGAFGKSELFLDEVANEITQGKVRPSLNPLSKEFIALKKGREFGGAAETQAKTLSVLSGLSSGKTIEQSIKQAEDALFNYSKLTDIERSVFRRIIPFYTFARKNFELQLKTLATQPGKVANQLKFFRGLSNTIGETITEEDLESLPSWILEGVGIKQGTDEYGRETYFTGFGLPIEEFLQRFSGEKGIMWNISQNILAQTNPILKFPAERATDQDFFRGRPITEISNAQELKPFFDLMPDKVDKQLRELIEYKEIPNTPIYVNGVQKGTRTKVTANPYALHFLRNMPTSRITGTVGFLSNEEETSMNKAFRFFSGVRGTTIDGERQKYFNELKEKEVLIDWLDRMGVAGTMEIVFEKNKPSSSSKRSGGRASSR